ncbi:MAG: hypothetical protein EPN69_15305 [Rhodanobacter sp.]|nr:MAG: hypothetical protein EPN71_15900 [Rhodanobacter sp.]TAL88999.1 MAG: hypothetical protein EPN69_15305 [Rhodanobacter sp.]TAM40421.1 MAG: hypothetical protein EPN58_10415 [Rhodanobacter sp.]TAN23261.1 MAG: hypothetical protein EPN32_12100 [Rhodanobacter sp.]
MVIAKADRLKPVVLTLRWRIKIDAILRATKGASNKMLDLEELEQDELEQHRQSFVRDAEKARHESKQPPEQALSSTRGDNCCTCGVTAASPVQETRHDPSPTFSFSLDFERRYGEKPQGRVAR